MVMNVGKISSIKFCASKGVTKPIKDNSDEIKITELPDVVSDFSVKLPQKYSKIGVTELGNGLKIHSYKLANGHRVTVIPMEDSPTTVKNYVNVGSMNETDDIKGISHFLEHMAFNGTNGTEGYIKLERGDSFKKIDELGGWTNASTNYSLTDYVNSTPLLNDKDLEQQIQVIAAMTEDLKLSSDMVEKEKFPVCSEIDMIMDNPETVALDQTVRSLFNIKSSADELVGGSVNHIQNLDRQKVLDYYNKYYTPDNMHLVITGDVEPDEVMKLVSKNFRSQKISQGKRYDEKLTPINQNVRKDFITDKASSASIVIGFSGPKSSDVKSQILSEVVSKYLNSTEFGMYEELDKLSASMYYGQEKISTNPNNPKFAFCALDCSEENVEPVLKLVFTKFSKLNMQDEKELDNIKESFIQDYDDSLEYSSYLNDFVGKSAFDGNFEYITNYKEILNSITLDDVNNYIKEYMDVSKAAVTVMHPETTEENIINNYEKAKSISFHGKNKTPINMDKVSETTLDNNYKVAFVESKNNNTPFEVELSFKTPENVNPAVFVVLSSILSKGTMYSSEKEFNKYMEDNNISVSADVGRASLGVMGYSSSKNFEKTFEKATELLNHPRITQKEVDDAVKRALDVYSRVDNSSWDLYEDYEAKNNPLYMSAKEIKEGLNKVTVEDVQKLHDYIMKNSTGVMVVNIPEVSNDMKARAINEFSKLKTVKPFEYKPEKIYKENDKSAVLTEARNVSQADISQIYKFKTDNSIKEFITGALMNSILSSSDTIGLFNSLRERDHLAYRVNSSLEKSGDCGAITLHILTSTDNKDTGATSYDNLQKSVNGFHRQIDKLLNSEYKDSDLETAKRRLKANLLHNESVRSKLYTVLNTIEMGESLDYDNRAFEMIDSITREDIDNFSKKVFAGKPVYSIVASQDTLDYNKDFLNSLAE